MTNPSKFIDFWLQQVMAWALTSKCTSGGVVLTIHRNCSIINMKAGCAVTVSTLRCVSVCLFKKNTRMDSSTLIWYMIHDLWKHNINLLKTFRFLGKRFHIKWQQKDNVPAKSRKINWHTFIRITHWPCMCCCHVTITYQVCKYVN